MKKLMALMLGRTLAIGSVEESSLTVWRSKASDEVGDSDLFADSSCQPLGATEE